MTDFSLQAHVDQLYATGPRQLAFCAESLDTFSAWQQDLRGQILNLLGIAGRAVPTSPHAELLQTRDMGDYVEEKYALDVGENVIAPMYVLVPKQEPPYKAILAFHGHGPGVGPILGHYVDAQDEEYTRATDGNFAQALAQAGYLVCALEQRGFGERLTGQVQEEQARSCRHLAFEYLMEGRTLLGERCWEGLCALRYVQNRDDVVPDVMGCTGHSGGGTTTLWLSAIAESITVSVVSCYFCSFKQSILGVPHCECNYVPGILQYAEMGDIGATFAPKPLRIIAGEQDPIFPIAGVHEQYATLERAYALHDAADRCSLTVHPGGHGYDIAKSREWFDRWL